MVNKDQNYIQQTFKLARKARGFTSPNPMVGAVIVKNNKVIAQGFHQQAGKAHAEIQAFKAAKESCENATLYVNLEPCCHIGRTGPCVDEIIRQKIKRVVISTRDPNPLVSGKSVKKMRTCGIEVIEGVCEKEANRLNEVFFTNMKQKRAFVAIKWAQSLDGKTSTITGKSKWITSQSARDYARKLRGYYDAVLVGINTVLMDDPGLNADNKNIFKVIIDPDLRLTNKFQITKNNQDKLIIMTKVINVKKAVKLFGLAKIIGFAKSYFYPKQIINSLYKVGINSVFVEGGSNTIGRFFDAKLADKVYVFISPKILGGKTALSSVGAKGFSSPQKCPQLKEITIRSFDQDLCFIGYPEF